MSYDESDARRDEFIEQLSRELYEQHIEQFSSERLKSYYTLHPDVVKPAMDALQEGRWQLENGHYTASLIFFVSALELLLKATVLKPLVFGLVHDGRLADIVVDEATNQTAFDRYRPLLNALFEALGAGKLGEVRRDGQSVSLLSECEGLQRSRNDAIHSGVQATLQDGERARAVAVAVFERIVRPMLDKLGLAAGEGGTIGPQQRHIGRG